MAEPALLAATICILHDQTLHKAPCGKELMLDPVTMERTC